jgi:uncharacterized protein (TIGR03435 family)
MECIVTMLEELFMAIRKLHFVLFLAASGIEAAAQSTASFDVASIKLHPEPITMSADPSVRGSSVIATASTLLDMIRSAYGVRYDQISGGPNWIRSDHYDLAAKVEGDGTITQDQMRQMLQSLLADRFQLKIHREMKEAPVYELVLGKNGPKLKEAATDAKPGSMTRGTASGMHMEVTKGTMDQLARQLSNTAGRPVVDKTGLTGSYAYTLDWVPANRAPDADSETASIFTAVQEQLGLKLESAKAQVETIVIDRAEKPSGN